MRGFTRAIGRLLVMALVMAAVLAAAVVAGVGTTTAVAAGIVLTGGVGILMVARRSRANSPAAQIAAMMGPRTAAEAANAPVGSLTRTTSVEAMAPPEAKAVDAEPFVPRWRRPALLQQRHADPALQAPVYRAPMRFIDARPEGSDLRIVRYAVVPVLDRPDEVLGLRVSDLEAGDQVHVVGGSGAFLEVSCPNGDRGWVHRTTLGQRDAALTPAAATPAAPVRLPGTKVVSQEADDALTALLSARGLI